MSKSTDPTKGKKEAHASGTKSNTSKPPPNKRPNSDMCNSSAEELTLMSHTLDDLSCEMKEVRDSLQTLLKKDDIESLIKTAVKDILEDFNKNLEFTVNAKVDEKTKGMCKILENLEKENELLKKELVAQKLSIENLSSNMANDLSYSKRAEQKANYNEQYSRKNNIKFMDVPAVPSETESTLTRRICELVKEKDITLDLSKILAIHRIPGKEGHAQPILVKLQNNSEKTKIIVKRSLFKASGTRLVDDVTKANGQLISRLFKHEAMESAWYYNGSVYGKTKGGHRHKFDIHDVVSNVIAA